jgi:predicted DNA-binding protein (UPF0251 family)
MNNINALEKVLSSVENMKPPLWFLLKDQLDNIESSKLKGVTYKKMAEALGVSYKTFWKSLKKARAYNEKQQRAKLQVESENKTVKAKANKSKSFNKNDDDNFELPPAPGSKLKQNTGGGFIEL